MATGPKANSGARHVLVHRLTGSKLRKKSGCFEVLSNRTHESSPKILTEEISDM